MTFPGRRFAGLYVHIPFCASKCDYCDFVSFPGREGDISRYLDALRAELDARAPLPAFDSVFFGGGTPSLPPPWFVPAVLEAVRERTDIAQGAEATCEANPGTLTQEHVRAWREAGIGRLSLGAQVRQDRLLEALGRRHRWQDVLRAAQMWGEAESLSLDLMYGLPGQTQEDWLETLDAAVCLRPGHLSCYSLIVEEETPFGRLAREGALELPGEEAERAMHRLARERLAREGYRQYEVSNWERGGRACRHNLNTWRRGEYMGIGCAAASFVEGVRTRNTSDLDEYMRSALAGAPRLEEKTPLSREDALFEEVMLGLRLTEGVELSQEAYALYAERLRGMEGLAELSGRRARLTERGMDLMNAILVELMG